MAIVLALGVGSVESAIPNPTNKRYYACFSKQSGAVRLINYPKVSSCKKGERLRTWNAQGPQGVQGAQGVQGPQGPSGSSNCDDIADKPHDLADGQVGWGEVANKPAGFAEGVDDVGSVGYVSQIVATDTISVNVEHSYLSTGWPKSVFVQFQVVPSFTSGGGDLSIRYVTNAVADGSLTYRVYVTAEGIPGTADVPIEISRRRVRRRARTGQAQGCPRRCRDGPGEEGHQEDWVARRGHRMSPRGAGVRSCRESARVGGSGCRGMR